MEFTMRTRPSMDKAWYQPSHTFALIYMVYGLSLFGLPAYGSFYVSTFDWALWQKIITMVPLTILAGYGLNMMGFIGHEGTHGSLLKNRKSSAITGIFFASAVLTYFEMGFAMSHWNHHRYTNQDDDPDIQPVSKLKTWWQRILFTRFIYNALYFKYTWLMATGQPNPLKYKMAYPIKDQILFARLNFLFSGLWLALYIGIALVSWKAALFCVVLPSLTVKVIGACQIYIDHAGLDDRFLGNAYSRTSPLMTILFFGANYHLEHHAYPGIPCYRLPKVHKRLIELGVYEVANPPIVKGFFESFKAMNKKYEVGMAGSDFDAFTPAFDEQKIATRQTEAAPTIKEEATPA
ncbi:MAG: fatty acid desaturase [Cellvibrionales bacterium]|nr:fatty acid desaturase [Cellvibrionales bacterium]